MLFLLALSGAIAAFYCYQCCRDEITRLVTGLLSQICLLLSLIYAPWLLKIAAMVAVVRLFPNYRSNHP